MKLRSPKRYHSTVLLHITLLILCSITVCMLNLRKASAQPGFLNLDCGAVQNDSFGYIKWVMDSGYVSGGYSSGPLNYGGNFRYFNDSRKKNCYELPVQPNTSYLIRATFLYSNFSELYGNVSFDLTIDTTYWTTVKLSPVIDRYADNPGVYSVLRKEVILRSDGSQVRVCLVRGSGLPFINTLVLRTLGENMYEEVKQGKLLISQWRWNALYPCCIDETRYPDDVYDRIWSTMGDPGTQNTTVLNTSTTDVNQPPSSVMAMAWEWNETTPSATLQNDIAELSGQYYTALYFQEVDKLANPTATNGSRFLTVSLNGKQLKNVTVTSSLTAVTSLFKSTLPDANVTVSKAESWSLSPLLNGWEFYTARDVNLSTTAAEDVTALDVVRKSLGSPLQEWTGDPCYPEPWEWVTCNSEVPARVTQINLSDMQLKGSFPANLSEGLSELTTLKVDNNMLSRTLPDFSDLTKLQSLYIQNNSFSGLIPETLGELPLLHELFLQDNNFSGTIPTSLLRRRTNSTSNFTISYSGNPFLILPGAANGTNNTGSGSTSGLTLGLAIGGVAFVTVAILICLLVLCCCRKSNRKTHQEQVGQLQFRETTQQARVFTFQEVKDVTHNFAKKLGEGSYGPVFYGKLADGSEVAVKVNHADSRQGTSEFINEIVLLSRVHHKYLVSLVGYCEAAQQQILIYAFMPNGTLTDHLHGDVDEDNHLSWRFRLDIALNAAQGLEYLHTFCNPPIIHRDVKPSNILLDHNFVAKVADFGMSKSVPQGSKTGFSTAVKGTFGYLDPEYLAGWRLTEKSDVYSFGVVLLELITGRVPTAIIQFKDGTEGNFSTWIKTSQRNGNIQAIVDPALGSQYNMEAMWKVAELGLASIDPVGSKRPDMGEIVRGLLEAIQLENSDYIDVTSEPSFSSAGYLNPHSNSFSGPLNSYGSSKKIYSSVANWETYHQPR